MTDVVPESMKAVLIFRNEILRRSETFIRAQAEALTSYQARYVGLERITGGLETHTNPTVLKEANAPGWKIRKLLYQQFGYGPKFRRNVAALGGSILHAHFAPDGVTAMPLARQLRLPLVVTLHGYDVTADFPGSSPTLGDRIYVAKRGELARTTSLFICVSEFIRRSAIRSGFPAEKLKVHYIGVDRSYFKPAARKREPALILFVGRLVEKKGCAHLLRALAEILPQCPDARAVVIGDGPERRVLEQQVLASRLPCTFLGSQSPDAIRDWLWRARVLCVPSLTARNGDSEGLGMVFAEAQAAGLPVVSFSHGGVPEVVKHGETGLLAPEGDDRKLAEYLLRLISNEEEWRSYSERAVLWIAKQFDLASQTRLLEASYTQLLETHSFGYDGSGTRQQTIFTKSYHDIRVTNDG